MNTLLPRAVRPSGNVTLAKLRQLLNRETANVRYAVAVTLVRLKQSKRIAAGLKTRSGIVVRQAEASTERPSPMFVFVAAANHHTRVRLVQ